MRLKTIKLVGFKSFVDPTVLSLQSNITAIVGPNGCGKSNIVDAIRWVIGESSAKQLRGEALTDVIFNGTSQRKPVGQATIELIFDNSEGKIGGEYAQYSEISVRRELTRDAQSHFYLNNTRCRRRDIMDVFLGTGLGPRSYAIIEQGMISQLIEAKPEEVRIHLEEAAGISKYKERRRETENRIRHTRENLDRLNDLREEIDKQLAHLKRQANAAERFKILKQEQRLLKAQLHTLHWQDLSQQINEQNSQIQAQETALEAKIAQHRHIDTEIEKLRLQITELNDIFNEVQGRYYQQGGEIARIEQQIQHVQERQRQLEADLEQLVNNAQESEQHLHDDQAQIDELAAELTALEPQYEAIAQRAAIVEKELHTAEQQMIDWQTQWDSFNHQAAKISQQVEVENTRLQHWQQRIQSLQQRQQRLEEQHKELNWKNLPEEIEQLVQANSEYKTHIETLQQQLNQMQQQIYQQRNSNIELSAHHDNTRNQLHALLNRQASLTALQQIALGKTDQQVVHWLEQHQLANKPRLAESLQVETGWETAVETVLGPYLEAVCINNIHDLTGALQQFTQGNVSFINTGHTDSVVKPNTLAAKVRAECDVTHLLNNVYPVEDLAQAFTLLTNLAEHESIITREGIWLSSRWLRIHRASDEKAGILQRKHELETISVDVLQLQQQSEEQERAQVQGQAVVTELEHRREQLQMEFRDISARASEVRAQLSAKQAQIEQLQQRETTTITELKENQQQLQAAQEQHRQIAITLQQIKYQQQSDEEQRQQLLQTREQYKLQLQELRTRAHTDKQHKDEYQVRISSMRNQQHYLKQNIHRMERQIAQLQERKLQLQQTLTETKSPLVELNEKLALGLQQRLQIESELSLARGNLNSAEQQLRELEKSRSQTDTMINQLRGQLEQLRVDQRALQVRRDNHLEQIQQMDYQLEQLTQEMPAEANKEDWQQQIEQIEAKIQRLGPINLAAIEEFNQLSERKTYLDSQHTDLVDALTTLEDAMRKIDRETRSRLRDTFNKVNDTFMNLFPKIFGGGTAALELTDEDLLNTGILIKAQPPGKRNATIHLLSGGEKALTAIALVFSMFQLNPAPFCVLDEVDAPLDDANVNRFSNLVREMAEQVQFIFISHNKVTMEMAKQLAGVTMNEPGVSRLVSVDIDEAMELAGTEANKTKSEEAV